MPAIVLTREGRIGRLTIDNPGKFNAINDDMWLRIPGAMAELEADQDVRAIVVSGAGDAAFASGGDISQFEPALTPEERQRRRRQAVNDGLVAIARCRLPVIARIRGICMGGGLALASMCDIRIAGDDAVFRMPAARIGLGYDLPGISRLVELIGPANTADLFFSARKFDAADARAMGFVNRVVPAAELDRAIAAYCAMVVENAPLTMTAAKRAIIHCIGETSPGEESMVRQAIDRCYTSEDYNEGATAFMEKRRPQFKGR